MVERLAVNEVVLGSNPSLGDGAMVERLKTAVY